MRIPRVGNEYWIQGTAHHKVAYRMHDACNLHVKGCGWWACIGVMARIYNGDVSIDSERKKTFQKQLQVVILRALIHGYLEPAKEAIDVLSSHFEEDPPHDGKQLLDFFLDKEGASSVRAMWPI